jgi:hypothetical protein
MRWCSGEHLPVTIPGRVPGRAGRNVAAMSEETWAKTPKPRNLQSSQYTEYPDDGPGNGLLLSGSLQKDIAVCQPSPARLVPNGTTPGALDVVTVVVGH